MRNCYRAMRLSVIGGGVFAAVLLVSGQTDNPLLCLVQLEGRSMEPALQPGRELLFARLPWTTGDIILADVGESSPIVKRVAADKGENVLLQGDNRLLSIDYVVPRRSVQAVLLCRTPLTSPLPRVREPKTVVFPAYPYSMPEMTQPGWGAWQGLPQDRVPPPAAPRAAPAPRPFPHQGAVNPALPPDAPTPHESWRTRRQGRAGGQVRPVRLSLRRPGQSPGTAP